VAIGTALSRGESTRRCAHHAHGEERQPPAFAGQHVRPPTTLRGVEHERAPKPSRIRQFASTVYDAQAGSRSPILDGPGWLSVTAVVVGSVVVFGSSPWTWLAALVAAVLLWLPLCVRWVVALTRSVVAFREGLRQ
jgi:hypothetical protein